MTELPPRVLIVDDDRSNTNVLGNLLAADYGVVVAIDGAPALRVAAEKLPDIVLLDVVMPNLDGYEECRRLKASPATRDIPVVFITSMGEEHDEAFGLEVGAVDYVTKPFSPAILQMRVQTHVELKRLRDHWQRMPATDPLTGLAVATPSPLLAADRLLIEADLRLYDAKAGGRDRIRCSSIGTDLFHRDVAT